MPTYKGQQKVEDGVVRKNASSDGFAYCTHTIRGISTDYPYGSLLTNLSNQKPKSCMQQGDTFIDSIDWQKSQQAGYETMTIVYGKKLQKDCCVCFEKTSGYTASVSLQQVALIEHPKFKWILSASDAEITRWVRCVKYLWCSSMEHCLCVICFVARGVRRIPFVKLVQDYISYQMTNDLPQDSNCIFPCNWTYLGVVKCLLGSTENGSALAYANRIIAGVQYYLAPQVTITTNKSVKNKATFEAGSVGTKNSPGKKFSSWSSTWDFLSSGYSLQYDEIKKVGMLQETWIGISKCAGGCWDSCLYS